MFSFEKPFTMLMELTSVDVLADMAMLGDSTEPSLVVVANVDVDDSGPRCRD